MSAATPKLPLDQKGISDFLYAELLHTLGAYQVAAENLREQRDRLGDSSPLLRMIAQAHDHNRLLRDELHHPDPTEPRRHPAPPHRKGETDPDLDLLVPIQAFYEATVEALSLHLADEDKDWGDRNDGEKLGQRLAYIHDPQRRNPEVPLQRLVKGRLARMQHRLKEVKKLRGEHAPPPDWGHPDPIRAIVFDHLNQHRARGYVSPAAEAREEPFHLTILKAMSEAHKWMHQAEHLRSKPFGEMFTTIPETHTDMTRFLEYSRVLNTFVYIAARSVPWVFADSEEERKRVIDHYEECCENLTPTYCMWIGNQLSLLALERRGYTWWTMGLDDRAYCDFYKLTRLLRGRRRQVTQRGLRVQGTKTLVEGLTATAEHHIGRIYRGQHAHRVALRYFDRAANHLKGWEDDAGIGYILKDSRWWIDLLISRGKANYELGRMKASLTYYARAWRAFLQLADSESHTSANLEVVNELIDWLGWIADEPELGKLELSERVQLLVAQFETVYSPMHLRVLAADIMMRIGHLLYILKLPPLPPAPQTTADGKPAPPDHRLARRCMVQAAELDQRSTPIASDLLKISHGARLAEQAAPPDTEKTEAEKTKPVLPKERNPAPMKPPGAQWPSGGDRFEEAVRVFEYVIQTWLDKLGKREPKETGNSERDDALIADELLRSFLAHTDSSNVKLAQVYRYLMQARHQGDDDPAESGPTIDLVCLRRYSSFFPFLPRPAAFRALGGGYLALVREPGDEGAFGIAIDPGPHFLHNLYRCGYALADIDMVVLTHDHADHIASLDAMLALMGTRQMVDDAPFSHKSRLTIVGNQSIVERYDFFNEDEPKRRTSKGEKKVKRKDTVRVMDFDRFEEISKLRGTPRQDKIKERGVEIHLAPKTLCIEPVETWDHMDAGEHAAQGFLLSVGEDENRPSVLFTSDTGVPPSLASDRRRDGGEEHDHYPANGTTSLEDAAADADVVVAHLSSVPFPELRELSGLPASVEGGNEMTKSLLDLWGGAVERIRSPGDVSREGIDKSRFLLRQLQFAFRSRGEDPFNLGVSPFSDTTDMKAPSEKHLYLSGLLSIARHMAEAHKEGSRPPLLLIGELREELGTFRTRIANHIANTVFGEAGTALTTDIGLRVRVSASDPNEPEKHSVEILCTTCDLDNDLIAEERFHPPHQIREVCVKGENEGVFYNCELHDPGKRPERLWVESVERYNIFGD